MKYVKSELVTKASESVDVQVEQDLQVSDPPIEEARASIEKFEEKDEDDEEEEPTKSAE